MNDCDECERDPCLFYRLHNEFSETAIWEAERDIIMNDTDSEEDHNITLQKSFHCHFSTWNGVTKKPPTPHPKCVLKRVKKMFGSGYYMGLKRTREKEGNNTVNIDGDKVKSAKWAKTEEGTYRVEEKNR